MLSWITSCCYRSVNEPVCTFVLTWLSVYSLSFRKTTKPCWNSQILQVKWPKQRSWPQLRLQHPRPVCNNQKTFILCVANTINAWMKHISSYKPFEWPFSEITQIIGCPAWHLLNSVKALSAKYEQLITSIQHHFFRTPGRLPTNT